MNVVSCKLCGIVGIGGIGIAGGPEFNNSIEPDTLVTPVDPILNFPPDVNDAIPTALKLNVPNADNFAVDNAVIANDPLVLIFIPDEAFILTDFP